MTDNVTILDGQGNRMEWNGDDYVVQGDESDQYLESDDSKKTEGREDRTIMESDNISSEGAEELDGAPGENLKLKRTVGLFSGISLIVGTMIGSGIFVSPTGLLDRTGSVAMSLVVWTACGVVSMFGALAYAELGTMIPSSGAEYSYFMQAFGPFSAYMFSWVSTFIIKPSQLAIICMSFAAYAVEAFAYEC